MFMGKVLGLDIGVSSVGWGIIDTDSMEIIDAGVRLFEEATRNANEERRGFRGARRLKRRRKHRLERTKKLFEEYGIPTNSIGTGKPYEVRCKALKEKVSLEELAIGLYHIVKRRGTVLDAPLEEETTGGELSTKEQLKRNSKELETKYVCEIQMERLQKGLVRSHENRFRTEDYVKEAKAILNRQAQFYQEINDEFIEKYIDLVQRRRAYYEGPGSKKSPTIYGRFFIKNGELQEMSMIEKMRGKCSYFPEEPRIAKMSFTAELFDLLNGDLNKLRVNGEYLTEEDKVYIVEEIVKKGQKVTIDRILKYKGLPKDTYVVGYRVDLKKNQPTFTEFKGFKRILKAVKENDLPKEILDNVELLDEISEILTAEKSYERRENNLKKALEKYTAFDENTKNKIINALKEVTEFKGYHSLSKRAIQLILPDLWKTNKNQMELFSELGLEGKRYKNISNGKNIKFDDSAILSTVAKRAHREAIKIVNKVRQVYGELDSIVIETAREKNSEEAQLRYKDFQKKQGKFEKKMAELLGVSSLKELNLSPKQYLALKLWDAQDGQCLYSKNPISLHDIIRDFSKFEVDHIIPISISFDDSQENKVLCYREENQEKGQQTPFYYLTSSPKAKRTFEEFKADVFKLYTSGKISNKKMEYLLEQRDIMNNEELQKQFINRNLVDTRYAVRSFSMNLRSYFKHHNIPTKVLSIRGGFTAAIRRRANMNKDRDSSYAHHAIDALIVAAIGKLRVFQFFQNFGMNELGVFYDRRTGEILTEKEFFGEEMFKFIRNLLNYESKIKYSHKVDRKGNRSISNQTIYSTRIVNGEEYVIGKSGNIYALNKKDAESLIKRIKDKPETFFIAKHNPELFELILKIIKEYGKSENPFKAYYNEHGYIMKDGKVPVKFLRYYDEKLGVHLDISKKYPNAKNKVVLKSIKSVRIDVYKNNEGKYKYLGVPYHWFKDDGNKLVLNMEKYNREKKKPYKNIDSSYEFQFSLYRNDQFSIEKNGQTLEYILLGDANPRQNKIEADYVYKSKQKGDKRIILTIGPTIRNITKYNVDVLGNKHKVQKEEFRNTLQK
jgi:CRISPR-associated endonuclease Csn1